MATGPFTFCIDIGGTGIKGLVVDRRGKPLDPRDRVETPRPATPRAVLRSIARIAAEQPAFDRVAAGFPGVVKDGVVESAPNLHPSWAGVDLERELRRLTKRPARAANDAGVQGLAAIRGKGTEIVITLGTGMGFALFRDGRYVPNIELAHHPLRGRKTYEDLVGNAARQSAGRKKWNRRVRQVIATLERVFNYDHLYLGGGNAKHLTGELPPAVSIVSNQDGLLGGVRLWEQETGPRSRRAAAKR